MSLIIKLDLIKFIELYELFQSCGNEKTYTLQKISYFEKHLISKNFINI